MNDREFRQRIAELLVRKRAEAEEAIAKKPPAIEARKPKARREKA